MTCFVLQTVTQENYELRRQLDAAEETSGSLITELQGEVAALRERLAEVTHTLDTERGLKEAELDRLQLELAAATDRQEQLAREARTPRSSCGGSGAAARTSCGRYRACAG